jgi:hypothetical protein
MTTLPRSPSREHDLRMHLGAILMALQMLTRPPTEPLTADQQELVDIIQRASKSIQTILDTPVENEPPPPPARPRQHRKRNNRGPT